MNMFLRFVADELVDLKMAAAVLDRENSMVRAGMGQGIEAAGGSRNTARGR